MSTGYADIANDRFRVLLENGHRTSSEGASAPLELSSMSVRGEPIAYADAMGRAFTPIEIGHRWGPPWSTTWFHVRGRVPASWSGQGVVAVFDLGFIDATGFTCEALAWKDGRPWRGVDPNHRWLPIDGAEVDFYLEAAANPITFFAGAEPAPSMLALRAEAEPAFTLRQAELMIQDDRIRELTLDPGRIYQPLTRA